VSEKNESSVCPECGVNNFGMGNLHVLSCSKYDETSQQDLINDQPESDATFSTEFMEIIKYRAGLGVTSMLKGALAAHGADDPELLEGLEVIAEGGVILGSVATMHVLLENECLNPEKLVEFYQLLTSDVTDEL
jgi:hypothetical protein